MMRPVPRGTLALAGLAAGLAVGLVDGAWAALAAPTDLVGAVLATLLAAAADGLLGMVGAVVIEALGRCALWGRRARAHGAGQGAAMLVLCGVAGLVTVAAAAATVERRNRLLAAGVACLVGLAAGVVAAALAPALGRLLSRDPALPRAPRRPGPAFVL